jgi:hypothetical protein
VSGEAFWRAGSAISELSNRIRKSAENQRSV